MSVKFGTSGLRGLSTDLMGPTTFRYVSAFAQYLLGTHRAAQQSRVYLGHDFRDSSPEIAQTAMQALRAAKLVPIDCGALPTPALAAFAMKNASSSLMITGSHIPADRNGIKFYRPDGEIDKSDEMEIVSRAEKFNVGTVPTEIEDLEFEDGHRAAVTFFTQRNTSILVQNALTGLRVGVYQHSTVARDLLVEVLEFYGAKVTALGRSESFIPVDTEAVSGETLALLKSSALTNEFDVFVSADGDGDRPLVADENGKPLRGDIVGLLTAEFLNAQTIVTPITSNSGIEKEVTARVCRTRVGSPYVIAAMNEALAQSHAGVIGFEANGGVLTGSNFKVAAGELTALPTRDCFLPILAVLNFCKREKKPLSQNLADRKFLSTDGNRLENFSLQNSSALMNHLAASPENLSDYLKDIGTVAAVSNIDGLRVTLANGSIVHYRPSGNAPELRCYVEAHSEVASRELLQRGLAAALAFGKAAMSPSST